MINEIWLIHEGICIYHKTLKDPFNSNFKGLNLEKQLFSGFITALINFTKNQLEDNNTLQKISFYEGIYEIQPVEEVLVVLSLNTDYLSEQKLKQSVVSLTNEISYIIQTNDKLAHLRKVIKPKKPIILPLNEYNTIFDTFLEKILEDIYTIQNQLIMVDIFTLIQILEELKILFDQLHVSSKIIEYSISISSGAKKIVSNIEKVKEESTSSLYSIQKEFKNVVQNSIKSIRKDELLKSNGSDVYKKLLYFVKKNYSLLKQFQLEDQFFEEFIVII